MTLLARMMRFASGLTVVFSVRRGVWLLIFLSALAGASDAFAQGNFLKRFLERDAAVITVTDVTEAGKALRRPTRKNPVYYEALVLGYNDFGRSLAGVRPPEKTAFLKMILKLLADQGYYPAKRGHPPEMLLAFSWGTMNGTLGMALPFMGGDKLDMLWELDNTPQPAARFLTRFMRGSLGDLVMEAGMGNLYVISIQAFDEAAAIEGKTELLWHTKVSCPADGLDIVPTLRQMAREAAPHFGVETGKPVLTFSPPQRAIVDLGEMKVLETIDPQKLPITDFRGETERKQAK